MTENDPQLPEEIRKALKESPALTPPESFYRGVLNEIERNRAPAEEKTPWYWGYSAKGLATACVLVVMVLVVREKKSSIVTSSSPAVTGGNDDNKSLADTKEVQERLHGSISNLVGTPSPFEEVDKETKRDLAGRRKDIPVDALKTALVNNREQAEAPISHSEKSALQYDVADNAQARQTVNGAATQGSFINEQNVLAKKQKENREWKGVYSGISTFQTVVVRTQDDWQKLWLDHNGYIIPPPPPPDVDFANFMVVGVFDGTKPSGGYAVQIVDVKTAPGKMVVSYIEVSPAPGLATTQAITKPYHLQVVPRSSLPVAFEKASQ